MHQVSPTAMQSNSILYQNAFLKKCHMLIALGHARLDVESLRTAEEPTITGELVKEIKNTLQSVDAPAWMAHFYVADDPPQNAPGRGGKSRRRVDIEFERGGRRGIRPRLHFEAKRLCRPNSVNAYLGEEGLLLFVTGEYAATEKIGGMIGYVQFEEPSIWIEKIRDTLTADVAHFGLHVPPGFQAIMLSAGSDSTHVSHHDRANLGQPIAIFHTFLRF